MRWLQTLGGLLSRRPGGDALWGPSWKASQVGSPWGAGTTSGERVDVATAGALPAIYRAVSFIADSLASVELRVVEQQPDGGKKHIQDIDAARALADWSFEDKEAFLYWAALGGNGLGVLRKNARGGIQAIEVVAPRRVMLALDEAGTIF